MKLNDCPFEIDQKAMAQIIAATRHRPEGNAIGLWTGLKCTEKDSSGSIIKEYAGEHWFIGYDNEAEMRERGFTVITCMGTQFMLHQDAIEILRGSTLTYDRNHKVFRKSGQPDNRAYPRHAGGPFQ